MTENADQDRRININSLLVTCLNIFGVLGTVFACLVTLVVGIWGLREPEQVREIIQIISRENPPTPVVVVVTATSPPGTPTNTPQPTHTPAPTPTKIPSPTPSPIPDTPPGTVLKVGETWRQNGMTMKVEKFEIEEFRCGDVLWEGDFWSKWQMVIKNQTDQDLLMNIDDSDFFMEDDQGNPAGLIITTNGRCVKDSEFLSRIPLDVRIMKAGEELRLWGWGLGRIEDRQWYHFGITEAGRIEKAVWQFDNLLR